MTTGRATVTRKRGNLGSASGSENRSRWGLRAASKKGDSVAKLDTSLAVTQPWRHVDAGDGLGDTGNGDSVTAAEFGGTRCQCIHSLSFPPSNVTTERLECGRCADRVLLLERPRDQDGMISGRKRALAKWTTKTPCEGLKKSHEC